MSSRLRYVVCLEESRKGLGCPKRPLPTLHTPKQTHGLNFEIACTSSIMSVNYSANIVTEKKSETENRSSHNSLNISRDDILKLSLWVAGSNMVLSNGGQCLAISSSTVHLSTYLSHPPTSATQSRRSPTDLPENHGFRGESSRLSGHAENCISHVVYKPFSTGCKIFKQFPTPNRDRSNRIYIYV